MALGLDLAPAMAGVGSEAVGSEAVGSEAVGLEAVAVAASAEAGMDGSNRESPLSSPRDCEMVCCVTSQRLPAGRKCRP